MGDPAAQIEFPERFDVAARFQERVLPLETTSEIGVKERLLLYALKQQGREGRNNTTAPSWWNTTDRAKWDAWSSLGSMSTFEAMVYFTKTLDELKPGWLQEQVGIEAMPDGAPAQTQGGEPVSADEQKGSPVVIARTPTSSPTIRPQAGVLQADDSATVLNLRKQVDALQYRLACALRDVSARDALVAELRSESACLRRMLSENGVQPPPPGRNGNVTRDLSRVERLHRAQQQPQPEGLSPTPSPHHTGRTGGDDYYQPEPRGWFAWLTGSSVTTGPADGAGVKV
eukprot:Hpha_TRINITY_DN27739_c0_g1::TRINITY_DN27739_c0_g1_i1::g.157044::m.157044